MLNKLKIVLLVVFVSLSGCDESNMSLNIAKEVSDVGSIIKEKCNVKAYISSQVINNKIKNVKVVFFDSKNITCNNDELKEILVDYMLEKFGYSDIEYYIEYNENKIIKKL